MKRLLLILVGLGAIAFLVKYLDQLGDPRGRDYESDTVWERHASTILMLSSDEKEEWIRKAASEFGRRRPDIDLKVTSMSSVDGMNAILSRRVTPTLWSPAESAMLRYMVYRWRREYGVNLFEFDGEDAPRSLGRSPVVWLSWRSRIDAIAAAIDAKQLKPESVWTDIACAGVPRDPDAQWPALVARWDDLPQLKVPANRPEARPLSSWGDIKFFHTDPTRSNAGFHAIYLMAYQFLGQPDQVTVDLLKDNAFQTWFSRCQRLRKDFPSSIHALTRLPFQFGPKDYDIVVTYENLALENMMSFDNRWSEQPAIYYPPTTTWADHPVVILNSAALTSDQREAAREWIAFLLAPDRQRSLVSFGLRPARPDRSVREQKTNNPFTNGAKFNVQLEPTFESPPGLDGATIDYLTEIWRKATGYY
jgi:hypothetical protein